MSSKSPELLRLLYIGSVPVDNSYHGSALLYRLLEEYPPEKLLIIESNLSISNPERRLKNVKYKQLNVGNKRYLNTRFCAYIRSWILITAKNRIKQVSKLIGDFQPEAVLTVAQEDSWLTASQWAAINNLPLHLILHDDWITAAPMLEFIRKWLKQEFKKIYRQAQSRFCVSPFMEEEYQNRYKVSGTVLYPSRAKNIIAPEKPVIRAIDDKKLLTIVYGGTINSDGYVCALKTLAKCLEKVNGQLIIYSNLTKEIAQKIGLNFSNIVIGGLLPTPTFIKHIAQEADVLFLPMSFDKQDKSNMQLSFPSKLTDYTATGLPLLIYGPSYCSAVCWAKQNEEVAEVVEEENSNQLTNALKKLISVKYRQILAQKSIEQGNIYFEHSIAYKTFLEHLLSYPVV